MNGNDRLSILSALLMLTCIITVPDAQANEPSNTETVHRLKIATTVSIPLPAITVQARNEGQEAAILIDNTEVLVIRSSAGGLTPEQRAQQVQARLQRFLKYDGNPRDIKPGVESNNIVIRAGKAVLITLDEEIAKKENKSTRQVAFEWTNRLRGELGAETLERSQMLIASRSLTPVLPDFGTARAVGAVLKGQASWYGPGFHGRRTANGERYDMNAMTAAHKTLPFNTLVRVTNNRTGKSAIVRINDRGPYIHGRIIDLSKGAAQATGVLSSGVASVTLEILK